MKTIAQQLNIKKFPFIIKDDYGSKIYFEISDNRWYKREYDSNGNEIYFENSSEYWARSEYDSKGRKIYFEDSNGCWKTEYDSYGSKVYYHRKSSEEWYKKEYDLNGTEIYYEDSDGTIIDQRYKRRKPKVVEIEGVEYKLIKIDDDEDKYELTKL